MIIKTKLVLPARCCICERLLPESRFALKHTETNKVICLFCLVDIAEIEIDD